MDMDHRWRCSYQSLVLSDHALVASILDPRSKSSLEECGVDIAALKASVITLYEARYRHKFEGDLSHGTKASEDPPRKKSKLFEKFIKSTSSATAVGSTTEPFQSELERWMTHPSMCLSKSSRDACLWFKVNGHMYPRISLMARDYLSVMSTGVKSC
ncbi:BED-type domain-containing protein [Plasmodiophora brassicae]